MNESTGFDAASFRHSCESCRRKKTKCPAEKPVCSFCHRLNQTCVYLPRRQAKEKLTGTGSVRSSPTNPEPTGEVLDVVVDTYKKRIHFQPLPLLDPKSLRENLGLFPPFLRWSLLALTLHHFTHSFYDGRTAQAIEFYSSSSRKVVMEMAFEGETELDVLQALCLLALCDTMEGEHTRAWMVIGNAARLEALRMASSQHLSHEDLDNDVILRCHWSILILEKTFSPQSVLLGQVPTSPDYPKSAPRPQPLSCFGSKSTYGPELSNVHELHSQDRGINASCLQTICVWGDIVSYVRGIRLGKVDLPWLSASTHAQLIVNLYELENKLSHQHLLRNVSFADRSPPELSQDREYWAPWVLMQITSHAAQAVLNNPFIQLVGLRDTNRVSQPRSFLQQTVDQALFHAGWAFRMIKMCEELQFQIFDPLIAQLVAATATIPWLFQFARDQTVSQSSKTNLDTCERFLSRLARLWPHIAQKLMVLRSLNSSINQEQFENCADRTAITFQPGKLWDLLTIDTNLSRTGPSLESNGQTSTSITGPCASATLYVTTKFIHPLADPVEPVDVATHETDSFSTPLGESYEELSLDQFLAESMLTDFLGLPNQDDAEF
ncbi:Fc.00g045320.m01.CDS01 [Cosmosporella sp. VM-42]